MTMEHLESRLRLGELPVDEELADLVLQMRMVPGLEVDLPFQTPDVHTMAYLTDEIRRSPKYEAVADVVDKMLKARFDLDIPFPYELVSAEDRQKIETTIIRKLTSGSRRMIKKLGEPLSQLPDSFGVDNLTFERDNSGLHTDAWVNGQGLSSYEKSHFTTLVRGAQKALAYPMTDLIRERADKWVWPDLKVAHFRSLPREVYLGNLPITQPIIFCAVAFNPELNSRVIM